MARVARTPEGRTWIVRRLWLPRLRRRGDGGDGGSGGDDDDEGDGDGWPFPFEIPGEIGASLLVVAAVLAVALIVFFLLPYIFFLLELIALPLLFAYRIAFRRPWTVEALPLARLDDRLRWKVVGWRRSGNVVEEIARAIERGDTAFRPSDAEPITTSPGE